MSLIESVRGASVRQEGQGGSFYVWKRDRYHRVTTVIAGGLPKPVLVNWAKKFTAEYAVEHLDQLNALVRGPKGDPDGAIEWLKGAAYRDRDKKANLGSIIHDIAEAHVIGRPYPSLTEEQQPFVAAFLDWLADFQPTFLAVEMPVFSRRYLYAGTLDAIVDIPVEFVDEEKLQGLWGQVPEDRPWRVLVDYKTGASGPWAEVGLQLAAYRHAEFTGLPNDREGDMPEVDGCAVLKIRPEGCEFYPVRADQLMHECFLFCREVYRFAKEHSKNVIGERIFSEAALQRALEQSLEASDLDRSSYAAASETEGGGQAKDAIAADEEPAPPSPKPRKSRAKKAAS